jgi:hypothetical protein
MDLRSVVQVSSSAAWSSAEHFTAAAKSGAEQVSAAARTGAEHVAVVADNVSAAARTGAGHVAAVADNVREQWHQRSPIFDVLHRGDQVTGEAWGNAEPGTQTRPPMVLRLTSYDQLTPCSMEVEWENGSGERQRWSSHWHPLCSFFEAEKVLPSSVTDVSVSFKVQAVVKSYFIPKVSMDEEHRLFCDDSGESVPETFWFWTTDHNAVNDSIAIDITFEIKGSPSECRMNRVWNAARGSLPIRAYEFWPDIESRPLPRPHLQVLQDTDCAATPADCHSDPVSLCDIASRRLVAAAKAVQQERRQTLSELHRVDEHLTRQWVAVNSTNTAGAGLAVASAAALFINPLVGLGLGVASAATNGVATAGDYLADQAILSDVRWCLNKDDMNIFAVADLQQEWLRAHDHAGLVLSIGKNRKVVSLEEVGFYGRTGARVGLAVASTVANAAETASSLAVSSTAASSAAAGARVAPLASKALGVAGAVVSTGLAVHGWVTTKSLQTLARQRLTEISQSMLGTQRWLAAISELECVICLSSIELQDEAQCCEHSWHYSHRKCLQQWEAECTAHGRMTSCPLCCGPLSSRRGRLEDLMMEDMCMLVPEAELEVGTTSI